MKKALSIIVGLFILIIACGDSGDKDMDPSQSQMTDIKIHEGVQVNLSDRIYDKVDRLPLFDGCATKKCSDQKLMKYIVDHVKYPKSALQVSAEGKVFVQFVVDAGGYVKHIEVKKSPHESLSKESIRVVQSFNTGHPLWSPGILDGEEVAVRYTLPFSYKAES